MDDEELVRDVSHALLTHLGYKVTVAVECLKRLKVGAVYPGRDFNEKNQLQITHHYSGNHYFGHFDVRDTYFVLQPSAEPHL